MKKLFVSLVVAFMAATAVAETKTVTPGGVTQAAADLRYCQLAGCTMTGADLHANGTSAAPSDSFANFPTFGLYAAAGTLGEAMGTGQVLVTGTTAAPTALTATIGAGAGVTAGTHSYKVTFVTAGGETDAGALSNQVTTAAGNLQVNLTAIPLGNAFVTSRKIYRTIAGDTGSYLLQQTLANNTATTATDNTPDGSLGAAIPATNAAIDTRWTFANSGNVTQAQGSFTPGSLGIVMGSTGPISFNGSVLVGGGANILRVANTTTAQSLQICNTCDVNAGALTNAEYLSLNWTDAANTASVVTAKVGTGTLRALRFGVGAQTWGVEASNNNFQPTADNSRDIGAASLRIRHIYPARLVTGAATPTTSVAAGFCTSPSVGVDTGSSDLAGIITITTGSGCAAATGSITVTFSTGSAYGTNTPVCTVAPLDGAAAWDTGVTWKLTAASTTAFTTAWKNAATNFTSSTTYKMTYQCIGK